MAGVCVCVCVPLRTLATHATVYKKQKWESKLDDLRGWQGPSAVMGSR